jgi:hypothetical protein
MTEGAMTEGAMTEGAMTEGAMTEGAMTGEMTWKADRAPTGSDRPLTPVALDKTQNLALEPARDTLAGRIVGAVQNVLVWHIDPGVRRV